MKTATLIAALACVCVASIPSHAQNPFSGAKSFEISLYAHSLKPVCREGFIPIMGFGAGWYCAAGYKPQ